MLANFTEGGVGGGVTSTSCLQAANAIIKRATKIMVGDDADAWR